MTGFSLKTNKTNSITLLQFIIIIHSMQLGVGVISMPRDLAKTAGTDGWIALLIGYGISVIASIIIIQIMQKHPNGTIIDLISHFFGKFFGHLMSLVFGIYMCLFAYLILDRMVLLIRSWIMQQSQDYVLMLLFVVPAYMIVKGGVRIIARYGEVVILCSLWMPVVLLTLFSEAHWLNLLPILKEGWMPVLRTVNTTVISFLGFEAAFFIYPHLENKKKATFGIIIANTMTLLVYLYVTILCFVVYSPDEIQFFNDTMLTVVKVIEYRFLERFDIVMLTCYLLVISKTWIPALYMTVYCSKKLFHIGSVSKHIVVLLAEMVLITYIWEPGWNASTTAIQYFTYFGIVMAFFFPLCLWGILSIMTSFPRWNK
ncbi:endospore germination permease [Paenibacillus sp. CF384]|uniref:GerAB/ArcD/ProY family transporter n=1 Tax=Paenibacillus sp. CF384 TaxID=1884382 RepID=UPI000895FBBD|nr:endospore germination permease [Paenibacillus sp. CF384]SDW12582.1 spore germination protein (amino acid permease) [Paenibacillus sp. CF384]